MRDLPELQWIQFDAEGYSRPVSGSVFRTEHPPCCGVPLGGVGTGCLDIDARGVYGYSTIFNEHSPHPFDTRGWRIARKLPAIQPILALAVDGNVWALASEELIRGGQIPWCTDPSNDPNNSLSVDCADIEERVKAVREIHYWGHFPIADLEYETDAPVSVSLRAWSPFVPGDTAASHVPAIVFEVCLCNGSEAHEGTIVFNFPGPDTQEARATEFTRREIREDFHGMLVRSTGGVEYVAGVIGDEKVRFGAGLCGDSAARRVDTAAKSVDLAGWADIVTTLPQPRFREDGGDRRYVDSSCSVAADFALRPGQTKRIRFLLAWYAPVIEGVRKTWTGDGFTGFHTFSWWTSRWAGHTNFYTHMYAARYGGAVDVARRMAQEHDTLLERVMAWQDVIYAEETLPVWLRDSLVNNLALITEDGYWFQPKPPLGDFAHPGGLFAMNESPRACPQMACIPCDWYGNWPIVLFFPELARSTLKAFKHYQKQDGEVPFAIGRFGDLPDMATPEYRWQISLNGTCYVDLLHRLWQRTGDDTLLDEFYESARTCNTFTMNLCSGPDNVISMPDIGGMEWFEFGEWAGMATHLGGLRLAQLRMMKHMAEAVSDGQYARQCQTWFDRGSRAMEEEMWNGSYYLNFHDKEAGRKSDEVMASQLDGHWAAAYHGLPGVFDSDRVGIALETVKRCNIALTPDFGAANFTRPDGSALPADDKVAAYGPYTMFTSETLVLAATYMWQGQKEFGLDLARRLWENNVLRQRHGWDLPVMVRGDTGQRVNGTDYYQNMMLWVLPAALAGEDIKSSCARGGLIDRIIRAGRKA